MGHHEGGREVRAQHGLERLERLLAHERAVHHAGGVHQQVDRARLGDHRREAAGSALSPAAQRAPISAAAAWSRSAVRAVSTTS